MMAVLYIHWRVILTFLVATLCLFLYNEFLVYYVTLLQCSWPPMDGKLSDFAVPRNQKEILKVVVLADTHLLGSKEGHWFDKLRREWQMKRSFQTAMTLFSPDMVFILGDLFDEGKWCSDAEFQDYVRRYHEMFYTPFHTDTKVVVGNHDIGFHYMVDESKKRRFSSAFDAPSVNMVHSKGNIFLLLNSMAFEGDHCDMCREAEQQLMEAAQQLRCAQGNPSDESCSRHRNFKYTRPIILQHFPMYRNSDINCSGPDAAPLEEKSQPFVPRHDCLSQQASDMLFRLIQPRLVISGHTHHYCHRVHPDGTPEWTVPSFSWRNKKNPSFLLLTVDNSNFTTEKCFLPDERTVIATYIIGGVLIVLWVLVRLYLRLKNREPPYRVSLKHR